MTLTIGITDSRARSGGGIVHLAGILREARPADVAIDKINVWSCANCSPRFPMRN